MISKGRQGPPRDPRPGGQEVANCAGLAEFVDREGMEVWEGRGLDRGVLEVEGMDRGVLEVGGVAAPERICVVTI